MSSNTIHIKSENPDLLIEFELPPGTHALIGASPKSEITLPLGGIPPFCCTLGRFHDGRPYLANLDGTIERRVNLPDLLEIPPYEFVIYQPEPPEESPAETGDSSRGKRRSPAAAAMAALSSLFRSRSGNPPK
jgi:hypothetical protein